ncbi:MAG TPA: T9SS type A sorting domain-containing protein, partial [Saprospiraceae bacterium]|nr:T9SS type A sorting domain-containing protein [Saprospiraceae bacterium]
SYFFIKNPNLSLAKGQLLSIKGSGGFELQKDAYRIDPQEGYFRSIWIPLEGEALKLAANDQLILEVAVKKDFESLDGLIRLLSNSHFFPGMEEVVWQLHPVKEAELSNIWPNPFRDYLHFSAIEENSCHIQIIDSRGSILYENDDSPNQELSISTVNWPSGVYYYKLQLGSQLKSGKLIKQ